MGTHAQARLDLEASFPHHRGMSARTLLIEEIARVPESVARELLGQWRALMPGRKPESPAKDHFEAYWKDLYGSLEGVEWDEPAELPNVT